MKNSIRKLELGDGNTAKTDEKKSLASTIFLSFVLQNETLNNILALYCTNNSDGVCSPWVFITPAAVYNKLKTLNPTRSEGPNRIPPRVLLEHHNFLHIPLTIFNNSMEKGQIPCDWRNAEIAAISKKALRVIKQAIDQLVLQVLLER